MSDAVKERRGALLHATGPRLVPVWLTVVLLVVLLVVVLGAGVLVGRSTKADPQPPPELASASTMAWLRDLVAATNSGDEARIRAFYADDATMYDIGNVHAAPLEGSAVIAATFAANHALFGAVFNEPRTAFQRDQFIALVASWGDVRAGVLVYELDDEGKILNQWAIHPAQ